MNKTAIKNFAVNARTKLIEDVMQKAYNIGINEKSIEPSQQFSDGYKVEVKGQSVYITNIQNEQREKLIAQISDKGYEQVMEEVAYTWFNRIIAIRFMEANDYLPSGIRVLSSNDNTRVEPDAIREVRNLIDEIGLDSDTVFKYQDENDTDGLFKYIFIKQCNALNKIMPVMFDKINDYTELLLPDKLLAENSVVRNLVNDIDEEDFKEQVEIIGWMYQYYISEKKDKVFADLKQNKKITKENIPAATQLFTPDWIVKYMVENSLGRLWLEGHPDEELQSTWKYYLEEAEQEAQVQDELNRIKEESKNLSPEEITVLDPSMGSGHILVYAFDVLYQIYVSAGYSEREIPRLILENNIYGLDIDDRAGQLTYFALIMKARSYYRRFFRDIERNPIELNVCSIQESNGIVKDDINYFANGDDKLRKDIEYLVEVFTDAKEYGSILEVNAVDFESIENRLKDIEEEIVLIESISRTKILEKVPNLVKQGKIMSKKYDICITNPPYMGRRKSMNNTLSSYIDKNYELGKMDMFSVFIEKNMIFTKENGFVGLMTPFAWMFINSYVKLRDYIVNNKSIINLIQLEESSFEDATVAICSFVLRNNNLNYIAEYIRLSDFLGADIQPEKVLEAAQDKDVYYRYRTAKNKFKNIPDNRIAYWISKTVEDTFEKYSPLGNEIDIKQGITTSDNDRFLRLWHEINFTKVGIGLDRKQSIISLKKWFPYNKGCRCQLTNVPKSS